MIRGTLIALALASSATAALARPGGVRLICHDNRDPARPPVDAMFRRHRIVWRDAAGVEHRITGSPDAWAWSCYPADGRVYPIDIN